MENSPALLVRNGFHPVLQQTHRLSAVVEHSYRAEAAVQKRAFISCQENSRFPSTDRALDRAQLPKRGYKCDGPNFRLDRLLLSLVVAGVVLVRFHGKTSVRDRFQSAVIE